MSNSTINEIDKILKNLMKYGDSPIVQKILTEALDNDNESKTSGIAEPTPIPDVNRTIPPTFAKEDEIV